ncbi:hypothetical protein ACFPOH_06465 [Ureibacillus suwonensis]|uniref:ParB/Sulfiredoxin domain-containing protein n=1 Tax=Ureibacillus suwonensis TaxID=313007 RepID=A0ABW0R9G8_9BACL
MAYRFTAIEPIRYHEFDYEKFLNFSIANSQLGELPFRKEWKDKWLSILTKYDDDVKKYIESHSDTNPMLERAKANPKQFKKRNEMFLYEFTSPNAGSFYFHFDVEKIKRLAEKNRLHKVTLNRFQFYLDKDTPYEKSRIINSSLPIFAPIFAVPQQYVAVDGNKRIMAKLINGERKFSGLALDPQQAVECFFFDLDAWFYRLLREMSSFSKLIYLKIPFSEIKNQSFVL